jgi:DNA-binding MarR family transcriptional regulator
MSNTVVQPQQTIISRSSQLVRLGGKVLEKRLAPFGVSFQEFRIVGLLLGDEDITQKDLAEKLSVRAATLSVAISKLEARGIVKREASSSDKRVNYLRLTSNKLIAEMVEIVFNFEQEISRGVNTADLQTARKVLTLLIDNLSNIDQ